MDITAYYEPEQIYKTFTTYVHEIITTAQSLQNASPMDDIDKIRKISTLSKALLTIRYLIERNELNYYKQCDNPE